MSRVLDTSGLAVALESGTNMRIRRCPCQLTSRYQEDGLDVEKEKAIHELVQSKNMGLMKIRTNTAFFISEDSRFHVIVRIVVL